MSYFCHPNDTGFKNIQLEEAFINYEEGVPTGEILSDKDILEIVEKEEDEDIDDDDEVEVVEQPRVSYNDAQKAIDTLKLYFKQSDELSQYPFDLIDSLQLNLEEASYSRKTQPTLENFLI